MAGGQVRGGCPSRPRAAGAQAGPIGTKVALPARMGAAAGRGEGGRGLAAVARSASRVAKAAWRMRGGAARPRRRSEDGEGTAARPRGLPGGGAATAGGMGAKKRDVDQAGAGKSPAAA